MVQYASRCSQLKPLMLTAILCQAGPSQEDLGTFIEGLGEGDLSRVLDMSRGRHRVLREVCCLVSHHGHADSAAECVDTLLWSSLSLALAGLALRLRHRQM